MSDEQEKRALPLSEERLKELRGLLLRIQPRYDTKSLIDLGFLSAWKHSDESAPIPEFRASFDLRVTPPSPYCFNMEAALEGDRKMSEEIYAAYCKRLMVDDDERDRLPKAVEGEWIDDVKST